MTDPYTRAANAREKARQEKNQWKARARKAEQQLAAVRKLHAPRFADEYGAADRFGTARFCDECTISGADYYEPWPCPTIQAIAPPK